MSLNCESAHRTSTLCGTPPGRRGAAGDKGVVRTLESRDGALRVRGSAARGSAVLRPDSEKCGLAGLPSDGVVEVGLGRRAGARDAR